MRALQIPPKVDISTIVTKYIPRLFEDKDLKRYIAASNTEYLHWEDLRYRPTPDGVSKEDAWSLVKFTRLNSSKMLPLKDQVDRPFTYWIPEPIQEILHQIDQHASGQLSLASEATEHPKHLMNRVLLNALIDEAIATSKIEGAVTTWRVAQTMLREKRKPRDKSEQMILNSYQTIQALKEKIKQPLSLELLHEIQNQITKNTLHDEGYAGRLRTKADEIRVVDDSTAEVIYTPPPAEDLEARLQKLIDFANSPSTEGEFIHPFVKAVILHFWLAYEHPYCDGNGRTARALIYWYLLKSGYWLFQYLPLSKIVVGAPEQYYRSFVHCEQDQNDLTYSIAFMSRIARRAIQELNENLSRLNQEQRALRTALQRYPGVNHRQRDLLRDLLESGNKMISIKYHQNTHQITYETARTDLSELAGLGFLQQFQSGRKLVYTVSSQFNDLLQTGEAEPAPKGSPDAA